MRLQNYALDQWVTGTGSGTSLIHAVTGAVIGEAGSARLTRLLWSGRVGSVASPGSRRIVPHGSRPSSGRMRRSP